MYLLSHATVVSVHLGNGVIFIMPCTCQLLRNLMLLSDSVNLCGLQSTCALFVEEYSYFYSNSDSCAEKTEQNRHFGDNLHSSLLWIIPYVIWYNKAWNGLFCISRGSRSKVHKPMHFCP